jgi:hypothetical protein
MSQADQLKASVSLLENNGRIFFFQPDIGVIASDENLEKVPCCTAGVLERG